MTWSAVVNRRLLRRVKHALVMQNIGRRIAECRIGRRLTQESLAERARVDARTIQRAEAGRHLTLTLLIRVAEVLSAPLSSLFDTPASASPRRAGRPHRERGVAPLFSVSAAPAEASMAAEPARKNPKRASRKSPTSARARREREVPKRRRAR